MRSPPPDPTQQAGHVCDQERTEGSGEELFTFFGSSHLARVRKVGKLHEQETAAELISPRPQYHSRRPQHRRRHVERHLGPLVVVVHELMLI